MFRHLSFDPGNGTQVAKHLQPANNKKAHPKENRVLAEF
jgi:hypothetical protein